MALRTVEDYGATPHDIAQDDSEAFDAMLAAERYVLLAPGKHYKITRPLAFPMKIQGQGSHVCRINCVGDHEFISIRQSHLGGFEVQGGDKTGVGIAVKDPSSEDKWVHDIQLQDIRINGFDFGMRVHRAFDISMRDVHVSGNRYGLLASGPSVENWHASGFFIQDNDEYGLFADFSNNGSHGWSWSTVKIEDNLVLGQEFDFECKLVLVHGLHIAGLRLENRKTGDYESFTIDGGHVLVDSLYQDTPGKVAIGPGTTRVEFRGYKQTIGGGTLVKKGKGHSVRLSSCLLRNDLPNFDHLILENVRNDATGQFIGHAAALIG